jgi:ribosomal protein S18 acetylase RimI-like enzyme
MISGVDRKASFSARCSVKMSLADDRSISIEEIPKVWSDEATFSRTIQAFRSLRLFALKHDPHSFGSTYQREIEFPESRWRERLLLNRALQIVASRASVDKDATSPVYVTGDWVGMVVAVRIEPEGGEDESYTLSGMFVHPAGRRQGLGRRLVERALEVIRADRRARSSTPVRVELLADSINNAAISLYRACGFEVDGESTCTVGSELREEFHMSRVLEIDD